jgi:hypothetical protein
LPRPWLKLTDLSCASAPRRLEAASSDYNWPGVKFLEGSEMTSGNIQLGPGPDQILKALKGLLRDDPEARQRPAEEVSKELVRGGYLQEEPDPVLVAEMLEGLEAEEASLQADEVAEEGQPT